MARIRTIKPEFWDDEKIGSLSFGARLMFIGSWNFADDEGLLRWNDAFLKAHVFIYDEVSITNVQKWMEELEKADLVFPYNGGVSQQRLGYIVNFHKHQRIDKPQPSKFPPPNLQNHLVREMYGKRDGGLCQLCRLPIVPSIGSEIPRTALSIDHIIPVAKGGSDYPSNLRATHLSCNKSRGSREDGKPSDEVLRRIRDQSARHSKNDSENDSANDSSLDWKGLEGKVEGKVEGKGKEGKGAAPPLLDPWFSDPGFSRAWKGWEEMRAACKAKPTDHARELAFAKVRELSAGDLGRAVAIINASIENNWKGFFPLKEAHGNGTGAGRKDHGKNTREFPESLAL